MDEDEAEYQRRVKKANEKLFKIIQKYPWPPPSTTASLLFLIEYYYHKLAREPADY